MSAAQDIIREVQAAGGAIVLTESGVKLKSDHGALPDDLVAKARAHKAAIIQALRPKKSRADWGRDEWQTYYDERAAIGEHDGNTTQVDAERLALEDCLSHWLAINPPEPCPPDTCAHCGKPSGEVGSDSVAVLAGRPNEHLWLHHRCYEPFRASRRRDATKSLPELSNQNVVVGIGR